MDIKTFADLIDWTRQLHGHLAKCLVHGAAKHRGEGARLLLEYLADHEVKLAKMIEGFEAQADPKAMHTYVYDYLSHQPFTMNQRCDTHYEDLSYDDICREVFSFHEQVMDLYRTLISKAETHGAKDLLESLLAMEKHEVMRLSTQTGRMHDL
ncbi:hypothetical protein [Porticoccus sp.]